MTSSADPSEALRVHRLKVTPHRLAVLRLLDKAGHVGAQNLQKRLAARGERMTLSTVYKNLERLSHAGLLHAVRLPGQEMRFGRSTGHAHHHLVCTRCGAVRDLIFEEDLQMWFARTTQQAWAAGWRLEHPQFIFSGLCPQCLKDADGD